MTTMRLATLLSTVMLTSLLHAGPAAAAGDPVKGKVAFAPCAVCHKVDATGKSGIGPNLMGVVGRNVASMPGFSYSPALKKFGGKWTPERIDTYITGPMKAVPGSRMAYVGMKKDVDRANVIAYLQSQSK